MREGWPRPARGLRDRWERWALAGLLLVHVVLGVYWSVAIPIWEAHDEDGHYYFVRFLATERRLPLSGERSISPNCQRHQPPLYYILAAVPVSLVRVEEELSLKPNPYFHWDRAQGGHNRFIHDPEAESWPFRGTVLAVRVARWVSVALGALALLFTFLTARTLFPEEPWVRWGAVLIHAFWPQFRFTTAVINNDLMAAVCAGAVTYLLVRIAVARPTRPLDLVALCLAVGLALLSKGSSLALLPVALIVLAWRVVSEQRAHRLRLAAWLAASLAMGSLSIGWWYWHNLEVGAELFGGSRSVAWVSFLLDPLLLRRPIYLGLVLPALRNGLFSFWAGLGWNNVGLPLSFYWTAAGWAGLGLIGVLISLVKRSSGRQAAGVATLALMAFATVGTPLFYIVSVGITDLHGRILLLGLTAVSVLLARGWSTLVPRRGYVVVWPAIGGTLGLLALLTPVLYISPAYAPPPTGDEGSVSQYAPIRAVFGGFAELLGYRIESRRVDAVDTVRMTLLWRVLAQSAADYTLAIQVFEGERALMGEVHRFPGRGTLTTTTWEPDLLFAEEVSIPIQSQQSEGHAAWIEVSFYDRDGLRPVDVYSAAGQRLGWSLRLDRIKVRGTDRTHWPVRADSVQFGPALRLTGGAAAIRAAQAGPALELTLDWATLAPPERDYTVSIQLRDRRDSIISQVDGQPRQGSYPASFWEPGELIRDSYTLPLPANLPDGSYTLYACVYDLATLHRLAAVDPHRGRQVGDEVALAELQVQAGRLRLRPGQPLIRAP